MRLFALVALLGLPLAASAQFPPGSVHPGDRLVIKFLGEALLPDTVVVNDRGTVVLPKLGSVPLAGTNIDRIPDSLRVRYAAYLRNPDVEVTVLRRIVVSGEVKRPDVYLVDARTTLSDAIAHAGGLTDSANPGNVSITRAGRAVAVRDWDRPGESARELESGDQIIVGRKSWFEMNILAAVSTLAIISSVLISLKR
jgi:protein involved in polysaccharide export with SLBB domain